MRLSNLGANNRGHNYRVVLDTEKVITNYIERTKGVHFHEEESRHYCSRCGEEVNWMHWSQNDTFATNKCSCGNRLTLLIIAFSEVAEGR